MAVCDLFCFEINRLQSCNVMDCIGTNSNIFKKYRKQIFPFFPMNRTIMHFQQIGEILFFISETEVDSSDISFFFFYKFKRFRSFATFSWNQLFLIIWTESDWIIQSTFLLSVGRNWTVSKCIKKSTVSISWSKFKFLQHRPTSFTQLHRVWPF